MAKSKKSSLLKRSRSITGKTFTKPSIKPQYTRKIIRRFHLLLNRKTTIYRKLSEFYKQDVNDQNIASFNTNLNGRVPTDGELLSVSNETSIPQLFQLLSNIDFEINENGGLQRYQIASLLGQESKRGSDSSKWLFDNLPELKTTKGLTALEIGCLSTRNVISRYFHTTRIDLNSNEPGISKQDFMERPTPVDDTERFSIISCSLVLNFVPDPKGRGEMLKRLPEFLKISDSTDPSILFIVLPLSCLTNSRYCDKERFLEILASIGFGLVKYHEAKKVVYTAFKWVGNATNKKFPKVKIHDGPGMNNFCIVIE